MKKLFLLAAVIAIAFVAQTASAGPIAIANAGFESYSGGDPNWQSPVDSWTFASNEAGHAASRYEDSTIDVNFPIGGATEGNLYLDIYRNTWIWQKTAHDLIEGVYNLSFEVADGNSNDDTWVAITIYAGEDWGLGTNQVAVMMNLKATDTDAVLDDNEFHTYSMSYDTADPCNAAFVAANLGDSIWVRVTAGPYLHDPTAQMYMDDIQMSYVGVEHILTIQADPCHVDILTPSVGEHTIAGDGTVVDVNAAVPYVNCPDIYQFDHWVGDVNDPCSPATTIVMDANKTITAVFTADTRECGDECHPDDLVGDHNHDCIIDFNDFSDFALNWLVCTKPECD